MKIFRAATTSYPIMYPKTHGWMHTKMVKIAHSNFKTERDRTVYYWFSHCIPSEWHHNAPKLSIKVPYERWHEGNWSDWLENLAHCLCGIPWKNNEHWQERKFQHMWAQTKSTGRGWYCNGVSFVKADQMKWVMLHLRVRFPAWIVWTTKLTFVNHSSHS